VNGSPPSTIIAPAGAEVFTHGGAEEVEDTLDELDRELEVLLGVEDDVEVVEGAALLEDGLDVLVEDVVGTTGAEDVVEVVEPAVLMQEQPLDIFEGKFEQADAQVGTATEVDPR
jgi:hypothetical protein